MVPKFQIFLVFVSILIGCITFVSCEREIVDPKDMMPPDTGGGDTMPPDTGGGDAMPPDTGGGDATPPDMEGPSVVINELMADNDNILADPQGDYDDWLELHNRTGSPITLTGMYLSDKEDNPTKWEFPENTSIPANGYLIVWLDEDHNDENATEGLHANFKLSRSGELVLLVDTDANGNQVLDSITFGEQETDAAFGRLPDGTGDFQTVQATPGAQNLGQ